MQLELIKEDLEALLRDPDHSPFVRKLLSGILFHTENRNKIELHHLHNTDKLKYYRKFGSLGKSGKKVTFKLLKFSPEIPGFPYKRLALAVVIPQSVLVCS